MFPDDAWFNTPHLENKEAPEVASAKAMINDRVLSGKAFPEFSLQGIWTLETIL